MRELLEMPDIGIIPLAIGILVLLHSTGGFAQDNFPPAFVELQKNSLKLEIAKQRNVTVEKLANTRNTAIVTKAAGNRVGYCILANGIIHIGQKGIPAVPGNGDFISEVEAKRTAHFIIT
ncbi:MAG: DUF4907 domain-containing protein [Chitinophagaceae bacterium]|jgi:hypothetical protein|nr:DUF4907 domain-containing protein [Chitinophagaceae bacterium]